MIPVAEHFKESTDDHESIKSTEHLPMPLPRTKKQELTVRTCQAVDSSGSPSPLSSSSSPQVHYHSTEETIDPVLGKVTVVVFSDQPRVDERVETDSLGGILRYKILTRNYKKRIFKKCDDGSQRLIREENFGTEVEEHIEETEAGLRGDDEVGVERKTSEDEFNETMPDGTWLKRKVSHAKLYRKRRDDYTERHRLPTPVRSPKIGSKFSTNQGLEHVTERKIDEREEISPDGTKLTFKVTSRDHVTRLGNDWKRLGTEVTEEIIEVSPEVISVSDEFTDKVTTVSETEDVLPDGSWIRRKVVHIKITNRPLQSPGLKHEVESQQNVQQEFILQQELHADKSTLQQTPSISNQAPDDSEFKELANVEELEEFKEHGGIVTFRRTTKKCLKPITEKVTVDGEIVERVSQEVEIGTLILEDTVEYEPGLVPDFKDYTEEQMEKINIHALCEESSRLLPNKTWLKKRHVLTKVEWKKDQIDKDLLKDDPRMTSHQEINIQEQQVPLLSSQIDFNQEQTDVSFISKSFNSEQRTQELNVVERSEQSASIMTHPSDISLSLQATPGEYKQLIKIPVKTIEKNVVEFVGSSHSMERKDEMIVEEEMVEETDLDEIFDEVTRYEQQKVTHLSPEDNKTDASTISVLALLPATTTISETSSVSVEKPRESIQVSSLTSNMGEISKVVTKDIVEFQNQTNKIIEVRDETETCLMTKEFKDEIVEPQHLEEYTFEVEYGNGEKKDKVLKEVVVKSNEDQLSNKAIDQSQYSSEDSKEMFVDAKEIRFEKREEIIVTEKQEIVEVVSSVDVGSNVEILKEPLVSTTSSGIIVETDLDSQIFENVEAIKTSDVQNVEIVVEVEDSQIIRTEVSDAEAVIFDKQATFELKGEQQDEETKTEIIEIPLSITEQEILTSVENYAVFSESNIDKSMKVEVVETEVPLRPHEEKLEKMIKQICEEKQFDEISGEPSSHLESTTIQEKIQESPDDTIELRVETSEIVSETNVDKQLEEELTILKPKKSEITETIKSVKEETKSGDETTTTIIAPIQLVDTTTLAPTEELSVVKASPATSEEVNARSENLQLVEKAKDNSHLVAGDIPRLECSPVESPLKVKKVTVTTEAMSISEITDPLQVGEVLTKEKTLDENIENVVRELESVKEEKASKHELSEENIKEQIHHVVDRGAPIEKEVESSETTEESKKSISNQSVNEQLQSEKIEISDETMPPRMEVEKVESRKEVEISLRGIFPVETKVDETFEQIEKHVPEMSEVKSHPMFPSQQKPSEEITTEVLMTSPTDDMISQKLSLFQVPANETTESHSFGFHPVQEETEQAEKVEVTNRRTIELPHVDNITTPVVSPTESDKDALELLAKKKLENYEKVLMNLEQVLEGHETETKFRTPLVLVQAMLHHRRLQSNKESPQKEIQDVETPVSADKPLITQLATLLQKFFTEPQPPQPLELPQPPQPPQPLEQIQEKAAKQDEDSSENKTVRSDFRPSLEVTRSFAEELSSSIMEYFEARDNILEEKVLSQEDKGFDDDVSNVNDIVEKQSEELLEQLTEFTLAYFKDKRIKQHKQEDVCERTATTSSAVMPSSVVFDSNLVVTPQAVTELPLTLVEHLSSTCQDEVSSSTQSHVEETSERIEDDKKDVDDARSEKDKIIPSEKVDLKVETTKVDEMNIEKMTEERNTLEFIEDVNKVVEDKIKETEIDFKESEETEIKIDLRGKESIPSTEVKVEQSQQTRVEGILQDETTSEERQKSHDSSTSVQISTIEEDVKPLVKSLVEEPTGKIDDQMDEKIKDSMELSGKEQLFNIEKTHQSVKVDELTEAISAEFITEEFIKDIETTIDDVVSLGQPQAVVKLIETRDVPAAQEITEISDSQHMSSTMDKTTSNDEQKAVTSNVLEDLSRDKDESSSVIIETVATSTVEATESISATTIDVTTTATSTTTSSSSFPAMPLNLEILENSQSATQVCLVQQDMSIVQESTTTSTCKTLDFEQKSRDESSSSSQSTYVETPKTVSSQMEEEQGITFETIEGDVRCKVEELEKHELSEDGRKSITKKVMTRNYYQTHIKNKIKEGVIVAVHPVETFVGKCVDECIFESATDIKDPYAADVETTTSIDESDETLDDGTWIKKKITTVVAYLAHEELDSPSIFLDAVTLPKSPKPIAEEESQIHQKTLESFGISFPEFFQFTVNIDNVKMRIIRLADSRPTVHESQKTSGVKSIKYSTKHDQLTSSTSSASKVESKSKREGKPPTFVLPEARSTWTTPSRPQADVMSTTSTGSKRLIRSRVRRTITRKIRKVLHSGDVIEDVVTEEIPEVEMSETSSIRSGQSDTFDFMSPMEASSVASPSDVASPRRRKGSASSHSSLKVYTDTIEGQPEVTTEVQEREETLPDGRVIVRKIIKTKQKQTIVKRVVLEAADDEPGDSDISALLNEEDLSTRMHADTILQESDPNRTSASRGQTSYVDEWLQQAVAATGQAPPVSGFEQPGTGSVVVSRIQSATSSKPKYRVSMERTDETATAVEEPSKQSK